MKKAFTLFSVIVLLFVFSLLAIKIYETKSITSINIVNNYKYIQGKNHLLFLEEYVNSLNSFQDIEKISFEEGEFLCSALVEEKENYYEIQIEVKSQIDNIRLQRLLTIRK